MRTETLCFVILAAATAACGRKAPDANYDAFNAQLLRRDSAWLGVVKAFREAGAGGEHAPGLRLRTALVRDTVAPGEPVRLQYVLFNGSTLTLIDNSQAVSFLVLTQAGDTVPPSFSKGSMTFSEGFQGELVLPRGAVFGQTVDLGCIEPALYARWQQCWYGYRFDEPGRYAIETRYSGRLGTCGELLDTTYLVVHRP